MPRVSERHPSRSRSAAVRLAALYPSRRQIRKWKRERRAHQAITGGLILVVVAVAVILGFGYLREYVLRANETAANVNGDTITLQQVLNMAKPRAAALDAQAAFYQAQGLTQASTQIALQRSGLPDQVLDSMVEDKLVSAELAQRGIAVSDSEIDDRIHKEISEQDAQSKPSPTPTAAPSPSPGTTPGPTATPTAVPTLEPDSFQAAYQSFLDRAGLKDADYRDLVRAEIAQDDLKKDLSKDLPTTGEMVRARHITVDNQDSLNQVQQALAAATAFDDVAKQFSTDTATRDKGGDMGWVPRGQLSQAAEDAAFSQQIGDVGQPVQTPSGFEIIQVLEKDPNHPLTQAQLDQKASKAYQDWYTAARAGDGVKADLSPEQRAWVLRQMGPRRGA